MTGTKEERILNIGGGNNYSILTRGTIVDFQNDPDEPIQVDEWFKASSRETFIEQARS